MIHIVCVTLVRESLHIKPTIISHQQFCLEHTLKPFTIDINPVTSPRDLLLEDIKPQLCRDVAKPELQADEIK